MVLLQARTALVAVVFTAALPLVAQPTMGAAPARPDSAMRRDSALKPVADQARGVDAEVRIALFELMNDRFVPALSRLQWLQTAPGALTAAVAPGALRGREDVLFLLAQSYYRLGMDQAFRQTARPLVGGPSAPRYGAILRAQLLLDAYRQGDYAGAITMSRALAGSEVKGLASLVAGLSAYQTGAFPDARAAFALAQQAGPPYAAYAQYMDALAQLRGDTSQTAPALAAMQQLASSSSGEFADQVRLTAAQLAYESDRFDDAASLAGQIGSESGLAAQALLTRAWALFKANQVAPAGEAFQQFATRFPQLPERDEARLMYAQALLQLGRTDEAARIFHMVADSAKAETGALQGASGAMNAAAKALVAARAAGLLFINDPASGKTVALQDAAGSDLSVLAAVVSDTAAAMPRVSAPDVVSLTDVNARLSTVSGLDATISRRVLFTQTSATRTRGDYAGRAQALREADVQVALARFQVQEAVDAQARQLATLQALQQTLTTEGSSFGALSAKLTAAQDSLSRMATSLDAAASRLRQLFQGQINATRLLADENLELVDSVRNVLAASSGSMERELLDREAETSRIYRGVADLIESGVEGAIGRHPVFALRDSLRVRGDRSRALLAEAQNASTMAQQLIATEIARLQSNDATAAFRSTLASAETRRMAVEAQLVAVVERELSARAGEMVADLRRDTEAAEFGSASALFFQALDAGNAPRTSGTSGTTGALPSTSGIPVAATSSPK